MSVGKMKVVFKNTANTVGILDVTDQESRVHKLAGFWNKELLQEAIRTLDLFEYRDVEVSVIEEDGCGVLLLKPALSDTKLRIAIAGKTEPTK